MSTLPPPPENVKREKDGPETHFFFSEKNMKKKQKTNLHLLIEHKFGDFTFEIVQGKFVPYISTTFHYVIMKGSTDIWYNFQMNTRSR